MPSRVAPEADDVPLPPLQPEPPSVEIKVAIASVQLLEDCPSPAPAARRRGGGGSPGPSAGPAERWQQRGLGLCRGLRPVDGAAVHS